MQRLDVSGAVRLIYRSSGVKGLIHLFYSSTCFEHYYAQLQEDKLY